MKLMFVAVGLFEGIIIIILFGLLLFYGSRKLIRKFFKNLTSKRVNASAFLMSIFLNPAIIIMLLGTVLYYSPRNQKFFKMRMEYEKQFLSQKDQQFTESSILGRTKEEILEKFGRADTTATSIIYDYSTFTSTFVVEIELEDGKAVRINKKKE